MPLRQLVQPKLKKPFTQEISSGFGLVATGELKPGQVQVPEDVTFYAPLIINPQDYASRAQHTVTRDSVAVRNRSGVSRLVNANAPRHESAGILMEPAAINVCTSKNRGLTDLSNMTLYGSPPPTVTIVEELAKIREAGYSDIVPDGKVYKVVSNGAANSGVLSEGVAPDTDRWRVSAVARKDSTSASDPQVRMSGFSTPSVEVTNQNYQVCAAIGNPDTANRQFEFNVKPGGIGYFVLQNLVKEEAISSVIINDTLAASTRQVDELSWPSILNQAEGMAAILWTPSFDNTLVAGSSIGSNILTLLGTEFIRWQRNADTSAYFVFDGPVVDANVQVNIGGGFVKEQLYLILARWTGTTKQIGYKVNGVVDWGTEGAHTPPFGDDGNLYLAGGTRYAPERMKDAYIWDQDKGTVWLETFFSGIAN